MILNPSDTMFASRANSSTSRIAVAAQSFMTGDREREMFLQQIIDNCGAQIAILDESGSIMFASRSWRESNEDIGGWSELNFANMEGIWQSASREYDALIDDLNRIIDGREREFHREYSCSRKGGLDWFVAHGVRLDAPDSPHYRIMITREDITRHKQAEDALRDINGRLIKAQEEERSRVARELHDDLSQQMAILSIALEQLGQQIQSSCPQLTVPVDAISLKAQEISSDLHRLSHQLHPAKLDHLGLCSAIKSLCREVAEHNDIRIDFRQEGFPLTLPKEVTLCVFRIAQESLNNTVRHSGALTASVVLKHSSKGTELRVSDAGRGLDVNSPETKAGLGFISMKERLRLVNGSFSIRTAPATGTQIQILVPDY